MDASDIEKMKAAIVKIADAIVEAVREVGPGGAPESYIHLALQHQGASYAVCSHLVSALIEARRLRRLPGHLLVAA